MIIVYEPFLISSINLCTFKLCAFYIFCCLFKSNSYFPFFLFLYIDVASCRFAKLTNSLCELALCLCFLFFFSDFFSVLFHFFLPVFLLSFLLFLPVAPDRTSRTILNKTRKPNIYPILDFKENNSIF